MRVSVASALIAGMLLSGCASTVYEGKYDWAEGWRAAEVVEVATAAEMRRPRFYECVRKATSQQAESGKFVVVKYRQMSRTQRRASPVSRMRTSQFSSSWSTFGLYF